MAIKLIRCDSAESQKIYLTLGNVSFGRGKLLNCDDKRISRSHGEMEVCVDHIVIKALHQNPCFYTKQGSDDKRILTKDLTISLHHGDRFGLLPDTYWYELLVVQDTHDETSDKDTQDYCLEADPKSDDSDKGNDKQTSVQDDTCINGDTPEPSTASRSENSESNNTVSQKSHKPDEITAEIDDKENKTSVSDSQTLDHNVQDIVEDSVKTDLIKEFKDENTTESDNETQSPDRNVQDKTESEIKKEYTPINLETGIVSSLLHHVVNDANTKPNDGTESKNEQENTMKRSHSVDQSEDVKKVKTEQAEVKTEPEDNAPGSSGDKAQAAVNNAPNVPRPRERCMYGANCYRRNPAHFVEFCHPRDGDWGDGAQKPCPFGAACMRRDPRHYRDHTHPPGHQPPAPAGKIRKRRGSSYSPPPGLIVRGKRKRRTIVREEWTDDDSDELDPFGSDESDEWRPEPGDSQELSENF